ncbi:hypothetical protein ABI59_05885 [Acidobacteria bacterium Mor1]|nr:hypothetical protein ABI59_05885 [Acidobacteria bacterium Mor1]
MERKFRKKLDAVQHYPMAVLVCSDEQAAALGTLTKDGNCVSLASDSKNQTKEDFLRSLTQRMAKKNESALMLGEQCFICGDNSTPEFRYIGGGSRR